jgi:structural maintenance of chromosome 1
MEHIQTTAAALEEQTKLLRDLTNEVEQSKNQIDTLRSKLEDISRNLDEARVDSHEDARSRRKREIVEDLKRNYSGVYNRISNICQPVHRRYNIPVTKVLGKYMEAIVVDNQETAKNCIQHLKEKMLEPETFLALSYLTVARIIFLSLKIRLKTVIFLLGKTIKGATSCHHGTPQRSSALRCVEVRPARDRESNFVHY